MSRHTIKRSFRISRRQSVSDAVRKEVWDKTNGHCWYCGANLEDVCKMQADHAMPASRGGGSHISNLYPSCERCNWDKRDKTVDEYRIHRGEMVAKSLSEAADLLLEVVIMHSEEDAANQRSVLNYLKQWGDYAKRQGVVFYGEMNGSELPLYYQI